MILLYEEKAVTTKKEMLCKGKEAAIGFCTKFSVKSEDSYSKYAWNF